MVVYLVKPSIEVQVKSGDWNPDDIFKGYKKGERMMLEGRIWQIQCNCIE